MNKLVIIGNGFDLAHGLPTRYEDFLLWALKIAIAEFKHKKTPLSVSDLIDLAWKKMNIIALGLWKEIIRKL